MNAELQRLLSAALALQLGFGALVEFTICSVRMMGLTAAEMLGATSEMNQGYAPAAGSQYLPPAGGRPTKRLPARRSG